jgi:multiple sugar transport system ATP-binding protein
MASVVLKGVCKSYGPVQVVRDVDLHIADGELMVLVGPSGCGKTTTLRMVAGLEDITAGELFIGDRLVNAVHPKDRDIAMVFQSYALYPHMTVYDNMAFGLRLRGMARDEIDRRVRDAAATLGIADYLGRKPKALSGGQRQRVAMGRAIVRNPSVFLFDEPLSNLDAKFRVLMRVELKMMQRRLRTTTIYVTHDQTEAMTLADRIAVMEGGWVRQVGTPQEVFDRPADRFVAGFIGSPAMNFMTGRVAVSGGQAAVRTASMTVVPAPGVARALAAMDGAEVTVGVRPGDVAVVASATATNAFAAGVQVVEHLGTEKYAYASTPDGTFTARLSPDEPVAEGETRTFAVRGEKVHVFGSDGRNVIVEGRQLTADS